MSRACTHHPHRRQWQNPFPWHELRISGGTCSCLMRILHGQGKVSSDHRSPISAIRPAQGSHETCMVNATEKQDKRLLNTEKQDKRLLHRGSSGDPGISRPGGAKRRSSRSNRNHHTSTWQSSITSCQNATSQALELQSRPSTKGNVRP